MRTQEIEIAMAAGANAYLTKPIDFDKLVLAVMNFLDKQ